MSKSVECKFVSFGKKCPFGKACKFKHGAPGLSNRKSPRKPPRAKAMSLVGGPKLRVEDILHECVRRVLKRHGPKKQWKPFPWVSKITARVDEFFHIDEKLSDPSDDVDMSMAGSLISMDTIYKFRLVHGNVDVKSTGGGVVSGYENADPSGGSGSTWTALEWSSLITLFSQVKMHKFTCHFTADIGLTQGQVIAVSGVLSSLAGNPSTFDNSWDNADSKLWAPKEVSLHGFVHSISGSDLNWAIVTTPNPGSYAGVPGAIQWYGSGFGATVTVGQVSMEGIYCFRSRI